MALKIVKHTEEMQSQDLKKTISLDIEGLFQKIFFLCSKVVDCAKEIIECTNLKKIFTAETEEEFEEKFAYLQRAMKVFNVVFGSRISIVDAMTKATTTMKNLQLLAQKFDVQLIPENDKQDEPLTNEDVDLMVQMMKDFGEDEIRKDIEKYNQELEDKEKQELQNQSEIVDVYDVYENKTE